MREELNPKEQKFVNNILAGMPKGKAAADAGWAPKSAHVTASQLLKIPKIRAAIAKATTKSAEKAIVDKAYVLRGLKKVAERCMQNEPVMEYDHEAKEMVQSTAVIQDPNTGEGKLIGVYEFDSMGANRALELLGKHLKIFTDVVEIKGDLASRMSTARERVKNAQRP